MVLHLMVWDKKFVPSFVALVNERFEPKLHQFIIYEAEGSETLFYKDNVIYYPSLLKNIIPLLVEMKKAEKIIIHGLFSTHLLLILALFAGMLRKCYWTIWGGDLYLTEVSKSLWRMRIKEWFKSFVIPRMGHFITHIEGDYLLAKKSYGAKGRWHDCFMYPSNIFKDYDYSLERSHKTINIQVGNSADPSNNHLEILEKLKSFSAEPINIYAPLSYGDVEYAKRIIAYGVENFGNKFIPLTDFLPLDQYNKFLGQIDIVIFNHRRQQGMGNAISQIGMGKKFYMRSDITSWDMFIGLGITIFDSAEIDIFPLNSNVGCDNKKIIKINFSKERLLEKLSLIFETDYR